MNLKHISHLLLVGLFGMSLSACFFASGSPPDILWTDSSDQINRYQEKLDSTLIYLENQADRYGIHKLNQFEMINPDAKHELVAAWASVHDYMTYLDFIRFQNQGFYYQLPGDIHFESFINYYTAFLIQNSRAIHFINIVSRNTALATILDEAYPQYGLEENAYSDFMTHTLHARQAIEYSALKIIYREKRPEINPHYTEIAMLEGYYTSIGEDYGVKLGFQHAQEVVEDEAFLWWFPIQKNVAEWAGTMRLFREGKGLISKQDIGVIEQQLLPGDILFQRREWALTNAGIPGYWTHAALYVGDSISRTHFEDNQIIHEWVISQGVESGSFEDLLMTEYPVAYQMNVSLNDSQKTHPILESLSPGVIFQTFEKSLTCDGLGVVRPTISELDIAKAIFTAFQYHGRDYDYNFDFLTDSTLVCSELVFKAFEPADNYPGIAFNTMELSGRMMTSSNMMVEQFDKEYATIPLEFVLFYDGIELKKVSLPSDEKSFRKSWRRLGFYQIIPSDKLLIKPN